MFNTTMRMRGTGGASGQSKERPFRNQLLWGGQRYQAFDFSIGRERRLCNLQIGSSGDVGEQPRPVLFGQVLRFLDAFGLLVTYLPAQVGHRLRPRRLPAGKTGRFGPQVAQVMVPLQSPCANWVR